MMQSPMEKFVSNLFASMSQHVTAQRCSLPVHFAADLALIWIVFHVRHQMAIVGISRLKSFAAFAAKKRRPIGMQLHVVFVGAEIAQGFPALRTCQ